MCRFVAYLGKNKILLSDLLEDPENSLIKQSHAAREGLHGVNADGFGIGWYDLHIDSTPGIFKSIQPAWNDSNLKHICEKIESTCFLAHVRASTVGDVAQNNCHPFYYKEYTMVHNGTIRHFDHLKKKLIDKIDEDLFLRIKGNTDSECFFLLVMHFLRIVGSLEVAVKEAILWVVENQESTDSESFSRLNIVITDGKEMIGTRFASKDKSSLSINYKPFEKEGKPESFVLSSEPLDDKGGWVLIPEKSYIHIDSAMQFKVSPLF